MEFSPVEAILISSPLLILFLISLVLLVVGLRRYSVRKEKRNIDPDGQTATFIAFGASMVSASGSSLLLIYTLSRTILFALCFCGIILLLVGSITLRKLVLAGKEYVYALLAGIIGMTLIALNFPFLFNIHEPFTMIYAFVVVIVIGIQAVMLESWKKKRMYGASISSDEQLRG